MIWRRNPNKYFERLRNLILKNAERLTGFGTNEVLSRPKVCVNAGIYAYRKNEPTFIRFGKKCTVQE